MCARHGRGTEICLSEKGALAKKRLGNTALAAVVYWHLFASHTALGFCRCVTSHSF